MTDTKYVKCCYLMRKVTVYRQLHVNVYCQMYVSLLAAKTSEISSPLTKTLSKTQSSHVTTCRIEKYSLRMHSIDFVKLFFKSP